MIVRLVYGALLFTDISFLFISVAVLLGLVVWWNLRSPAKLKLPYPKGLPVLGNLFQLEPSRAHHKIDKWARQLGGVYAIRLPGENIVVVSDYENLKDILITRGSHFAGRPEGSIRVEIFSNGKSDIAFSSPDAKFRPTLKKVVSSNLRHHSTGKSTYHEELYQVAEQDFFDELRKLEGKPTDVLDPLYHFSVRIVMILAMGKDLADDPEMRQAMIRMETNGMATLNQNAGGTILDKFPWLRFFGNNTYKQLLQGRQDLRDVFHATRDVIMPQLDEKNPKSVVEALLAVKDKLKHPDGTQILQDVNIMSQLNGLIVGGVSTTARGLYAFINVLIHHQDVMRKMHEELDAVVGKRTTVTAEDRENMPYTKAVLYELLRYTTINPNLLPHATTQDTELAGSKIPKNTLVVANLWTMHHDEKFWGDPWKFRPSRYLTDDGDVLPPGHPNLKRMLLFSAGPRVCPGEQYSMIRLFYFLANLMLNFDMDYGPEIVTCDPRELKTGVLMLHKPYEVCFIPRVSK